MGQQLLQFYETAKQKGGVSAQMRLPMKTGVSSDKANDTPDSPDLVAKFKAALAEIAG